MAIGLNGCSSLPVLHKDPGFTAAQLQTAGLAMGGVTRQDSTGYYADVPVAGVLAEHLKEQFPGMTVVPLKAVESLLGAEARNEVLDAFREPANLDAASYELLEPVRQQARFLMLVDVLEEQAPSFGNVSARQEINVIRDPVTKEYYRESTGVRYTSTRGSVRHMRAIIALFDLERRKLVWAVEGDKSMGFANSASDVNWVPRVRETGVPAPSDIFEELGEEVARELGRL